MRNSAKIKPLLIPMLLVALIIISFGTVLAATTAGPEISIPSIIPVQANSYVDIPLRFQSNGTQVSNITFSIDYNESWLNFDSSDPSAITFSLPSDFNSSDCSEDPSGVIQCVVSPGLLQPFPIMPDGVFLTIRLQTLNASDGTTAEVFFANNPVASFGGPDGQTVPDGTTIDGSVYFGEINWYVYLPFLVKMTPIPTTVTPTPETPTPTPDTPTPPPDTPTPTPPPGCSNLILNGGFEESDVAWYLPTTNYPAKYTTSVFHTGGASMRTGINLADNIYSYSSAWQPVVIPNDSTSAELTFYYKPQTSESVTSRLISNLANLANHPFENIESDPYIDQQMAMILNEDTTHDRTLMSVLSNSQTWTASETYNLMNYKGKTIWVAFTTYNDGSGGKTAMYVDDVVLEVCND